MHLVCTSYVLTQRVSTHSFQSGYGELTKSVHLVYFRSPNFYIFLFF